MDTGVVVAVALVSKVGEGSMIVILMGLGLRLGGQVDSVVLLVVALVVLVPDQVEVVLGMVHLVVMEVAGVVAIAETSNVKVLVGTMTEIPSGRDIRLQLLTRGLC
jgi:hypothetical protein